MKSPNGSMLLQHGKLLLKIWRNSVSTASMSGTTVCQDTSMKGHTVRNVESMISMLLRLKG